MPHAFLSALLLAPGLLLTPPLGGAERPDPPVSVTVLGRTNTAAGPAVTLALTNLTETACSYRYLALEPTAGGWSDARTQPAGAGSAHHLAGGAATHLTLRPPRGFSQWRMQFWVTPRGGRETTLRTPTLTLESNAPGRP
ncbi:MAG: hypothetical protein RJA22_1500 [Verrucomicrobiota bacterium]|jgi:hypothetical protein